MRSTESKRGARRIPRHGNLNSMIRHFNVRLIRRIGLRETIAIIAIVALLSPLYFHFKLRKLQQKLQPNSCDWVINPPLVCAHGGVTSKAFPNTMGAYQYAIEEQVDCIEVDVSRSADGILFALHDRDLQHRTGNKSLAVGSLLAADIRKIGLRNYGSALAFDDRMIPEFEDAITFISKAVRQVIIDVKIGPPLYDKGLAKVILEIVEKTGCKNCLIWGKNDDFIQEILKISPQALVGYVVMVEKNGETSKLGRIKGAGVAGVYHRIINENMLQILRGENSRVYAWTVDDEYSMRNLLDEAVDAIVTNKPVMLKQVMEDVKLNCQ